LVVKENELVGFVLRGQNVEQGQVVFVGGDGQGGVVVAGVVMDEGLVVAVCDQES
jgi:hypothetical protein